LRAQELKPTDVIDDINTGELYWRGIEQFCDSEVPPDADLIVPCPLVLFADEAKSDKKGVLSLEGVEFSVGWFRQEVRAMVSSTRMIGYLPNLDVGSGKNRDNYDDEWVMVHAKKRGKKTVGTKENTPAKKKLRDHHLCYSAVFSSLRKCVDAGGVRAVVRGKKCILKPYILLVVGDAKGYLTMTCSYGSSGNQNVNCLTHFCKCRDLTVTRPDCKRVTVKDIEKAS